MAFTNPEKQMAGFGRKKFFLVAARVGNPGDVVKLKGRKK